MARKIVLLPNMSVSSGDSTNLGIVEGLYENIREGELIINKRKGEELLVTKNVNGELVAFPSLEQVNTTINALSENVENAINDLNSGLTNAVKELSASVINNYATSADTDAALRALSANSISYVDKSIKFLVSGASEAFDTLKEVEDYINSNSSDTINILSGITDIRKNANDISSELAELSASVVNNYATSADTYATIESFSASVKEMFSKYATSADTYHDIARASAAARTSASGDAAAAKEQAIESANSYTDSKVLSAWNYVIDVEKELGDLSGSVIGSSHSHDNLDILNGITSADVTTWNSVSGKQDLLKYYTEGENTATISANTVNINSNKINITANDNGKSYSIYTDNRTLNVESYKIGLKAEDSIEFSGNLFTFNGKEVLTDDKAGDKNVIEEIQVNGSALTVDGNKAVNIDIPEDTTTEDIKVLGTSAGVLKAGDVISSGTSLTQFLKRLLIQEKDCNTKLPTCVLGLSNTSSPQEVGTIVKQTMTATYTDGKFTGATADYGYNYSINAGCAAGNITFTTPATSVTQSASETAYTAEDYSIQYGENKWSVTEAYGASTASPEKNDGTASDKSIAAGNTEISPKTINGCYKYFFGTFQNESDLSTTAITVSDSSKGINVIKSELITSTNFTIVNSEMSIGDKDNMIYLAIPTGYTVSKAIGAMGAEWLITNNSTTMEYTKEVTTTDYVVYFYKNTSSQVVASLIITKS